MWGLCSWGKSQDSAGDGWLSEKGNVQDGTAIRPQVPQSYFLHLLLPARGGISGVFLFCQVMGPLTLLLLSQVCLPLCLLPIRVPQGPVSSPCHQGSHLQDSCFSLQGTLSKIWHGMLTGAYWQPFPPCVAWGIRGSHRETMLMPVRVVTGCCKVVLDPFHECPLLVLGLC